jgi:putative oxidoreductase
MDTGLLVLRIVVGLLVVGHGTQKLFGWFGGGGLASTAWYFRSVGYRRAPLMARLAGSIEVAAGAALATGFVTPLAAAALVGTMFNASVAVHRRNGLWAMDNGYEYPLVLAAAATTLAFTGAGAFSIDGRLGLARPSLGAGLVAIGLGLAVGTGVLMTTRASAPTDTGAASRSRRVRKLAA